MSGPGRTAGKPGGGKGEDAGGEGRVVRRPPPRRKDGGPQYPGGAPTAAAPAAPLAPSGMMPPGAAVQPTAYPAMPGYPPGAYPVQPGYPPAMPGPPAGPVGFRLLEHIPGGPAEAEQARRLFLESQFDQVWNVYVAAVQQGVPRPVVLLLDHSDERGRRIAGVLRSGYAHAGVGPSLARPIRGRWGPATPRPSRSRPGKPASCSPPKPCTICTSPPRETGHDQVLVLVVSLYSVSGFRIGCGP